MTDEKNEAEPSGASGGSATHQLTLADIESMYEQWKVTRSPRLATLFVWAFLTFRK